LEVAAEDFLGDIGLERLEEMATNCDEFGLS
jgi:hypothetical protein